MAIDFKEMNGYELPHKEVEIIILKAQSATREHKQLSKINA